MKWDFATRTVPTRFWVFVPSNVIVFLLLPVPGCARLTFKACGFYSMSSMSPFLAANTFHSRSNHVFTSRIGADLNTFHLQNP